MQIEYKANEDLNQSVHFKIRVKLLLIALSYKNENMPPQAQQSSLHYKSSVLKEFNQQFLLSYWPPGR